MNSTSGNSVYATIKAQDATESPLFMTVVLPMLQNGTSGCPPRQMQIDDSNGKAGG
jgi:hypothetical protein